MFFGVSKNRPLAKYLFPGNALSKDRKSCASNMFLHVGDCIFINTSRLHIGKHFRLKLSIKRFKSSSCRSKSSQLKLRIPPSYVMALCILLPRLFSLAGLFFQLQCHSESITESWLECKRRGLASMAWAFQQLVTASSPPGDTADETTQSRDTSQCEIDKVGIKIRFASF